MDAFNSLDIDFLPNDEAALYLVGGTVRDLLCGHKPVDIDLAAKGDVGTIAQAIADKINGKIIHLGKNEFAILRIATQEHMIDIAPLSGSSIEADLQLRDFTINAMAYDIKNKKLIDCLGGLKDLGRKQIRMVSDDIFKKDPARLVRAYRMAATFGFSITEGTKREIHLDKDLISSVSGERVWLDIVKLLQAPAATPIVRGMAKSGLLTSIFPELEPSIGCRQNQHHQFDVFEHSLRVLEEVEHLLSEKDSFFSKLAQLLKSETPSSDLYLLKHSALLHDIGKPATRTVGVDGAVRFPGHAAKSAEIAAVISSRLKLSNHQRKIADLLIRHHIRPLSLSLANDKDRLGHQEIIRFFKHFGQLTLALIIHAIADIRAKNEWMQNRDRRFITFCGELVQTYSDTLKRQKRIPPIISGHDLVSEFGLAPSPDFALILNRIDELRLAGMLNTRNQALKWIETHLNKRKKYKRIE
jgi:putative nucleotidyltransferase with HDIG domain